MLHIWVCRQSWPQWFHCTWSFRELIPIFFSQQIYKVYKTVSSGKSKGLFTQISQKWRRKIWSIIPSSQNCKECLQSLSQCQTCGKKKAGASSLKHYVEWEDATLCNTLQHFATLCNTLPHYATLCNTLQHFAATLCNTCKTLQHFATLCDTLKHFLKKIQTTCALEICCTEKGRKYGFRW